MQAVQGPGIYSLKVFPNMFFTCCCIGIWQESDEESQHCSLQLFSSWTNRTRWTLSSKIDKTAEATVSKVRKLTPVWRSWLHLTWQDKDKINKFLFSKWPPGIQCPWTKCCCKGHIFCPKTGPCSRLVLTEVTVSATLLVLKTLSATTTILLKYDGEATFKLTLSLLS